MKPVKLILLICFYLIQYIQNIIISTCNEYKKYRDIFHFFFITKTAKSIHIFYLEHVSMGLATLFQVNSNPMWLVAPILGSVGLQYRPILSP